MVEFLEEIIVRKIAYSSLFLLVSTLCMGGQEQFLTACALYNSADYTKAIEIFRQIEHPGPTVWYNMGHCFYHLGDPARAMVCWWRADKGASWYECSKNKEQRCMLEKTLSLIPAPSLSFVERYLKKISIGWLQWIMIFLWYLLFCFTLLYVYRPLLQRRLRIIMIVFFIINSLCAFGLFIKYRQETIKRAVLLQQTMLYAGPGESYHVLCHMNAAQTVIVLNNIASWSRVMIDKNFTGWVPYDMLLFVESKM